MTIGADISLGNVSGFNQNPSTGVWKGVKFRKRERDGEKDCKKCIHGSMFQSCLWTLHSGGLFYSGEKLAWGGFKQQHCHTWLIHFRQSLHPISAPKGPMSCHTAPEYLISAPGPWLLHGSLLRALLFMLAVTCLNVFFRVTEIEVQGQQNGVDLLFSGLREAKTSSMWSEIWGRPIELSSPPQTGLLIHKETKALQGAWTLAVPQQKEAKFSFQTKLWNRKQYSAK